MQGVRTNWTKEMDEVLIELAAKYPCGNNQIYWSKVLKDPTWKWNKITTSSAAYRHKFLSHPSNVRLRKLNANPNKSNPVIPCGPSLNFCPHCGGNLASFNAAIQLNTLINGAAPL